MTWRKQISYKNPRSSGA